MSLTCFACSRCFGCGDDIYEITTQPKFQDNVQNSVMEYRFLVGKHMDNFNLASIFKGHKITFYDGSKPFNAASETARVAVYKIDLRGSFIYGVYHI